MLPSLNISLSLNQNANTAFYFQNKDITDPDLVHQTHQPESVKQHSYDMRMVAHNQEHFKETIEKLFNQTSKNQRSISCATQLSNKHKSDKIRNYESTNQEDLEKILGNISIESRVVSRTPISNQTRGRNAVNIGTCDTAKNISPTAMKGQQYKRKYSGKSKPQKSTTDKPDIVHISQTHEKCRNNNCVKSKAEMEKMIDMLNKSNSTLRAQLANEEALEAHDKYMQLAYENEEWMELASDLSKQCCNLKAEYNKLESEMIVLIEEKEKLSMSTELELSRNKMKINLLEETLTKRNKDHDSVEKKYKASLDSLDKYKQKLKCLDDEITIRDLKIKELQGENINTVNIDELDKRMKFLSALLKKYSNFSATIRPAVSTSLSKDNIDYEMSSKLEMAKPPKGFDVDELFPIRLKSYYASSEL